MSDTTTAEPNGEPRSVFVAEFINDAGEKWLSCGYEKTELEAERRGRGTASDGLISRFNRVVQFQEVPA